MEAHLLGSDIDTVGGHHVEGGVADVYDAGYAEDKGKPNSEKGKCTPTDEAAYNDVYNESHYYLIIISSKY
jgi:hypothetical protein